MLVELGLSTLRWPPGSVRSWFMQLPPMSTVLCVRLRHLWPSGKTPLVQLFSGQNDMKGEETENNCKFSKEHQYHGGVL